MIVPGRFAGPQPGRNVWSAPPRTGPPSTRLSHPSTVRRKTAGRAGRPTQAPKTRAWPTGTRRSTRRRTTSRPASTAPTSRRADGCARSISTGACPGAGATAASAPGPSTQHLARRALRRGRPVRAALGRGARRADGRMGRPAARPWPAAVRPPGSEDFESSAVSRRRWRRWRRSTRAPAWRARGALTGPPAPSSARSSRRTPSTARSPRTGQRASSSPPPPAPSSWSSGPSAATSSPPSCDPRLAALPHRCRRGDTRPKGGPCEGHRIPPSA